MPDKIDVSNIPPFCHMERRVVDNIPMIFCPNTYVKTVFDKDGFSTYYFSEKPLPGYHIHPAFVKNGEINPTGVLWSCNIYDRDTAVPSNLVTKAAAYGEGFEPYNIYDHHFIARLMLYECGDSDTQLKLGASTNAVAVAWNGINNIWGAHQNGVWPINGFSNHIYGLFAFDGVWHILSNKMDGSIVNTGVPTKPENTNIDNALGYPITLHSEKGNDFDLSDVFLAKTISGSMRNCSIVDSQQFAKDKAAAYHNHFYSNDKSRGIFHLALVGTTEGKSINHKDNRGKYTSLGAKAINFLGLRLRKAV